MNTEKLSTGCGLSTASLKKREGEKRKSPCTPLREKGKGKEHRRGSLQNRLSRARTRMREALDMEHDERMADIMERRRKKREEKRRNRAVKRVKDALGIVYADVPDAYLHQRTWRDIGIPKRTFGDRLKKVKIFFHA